MDFTACSVFSVREGLCNCVRVGRDVQEESLCSCLLKMEPSGATSVPLILLEASLNLLSSLLAPFRGDYFKPHYLKLWAILWVYSLQISPSSLCFVLADPPASASPGD